MPVLLEGRLMTTQNRLAPAEAYCSVCRKWHPMAEYAWGTYKCKACMRAYNRAYYLKRKARAGKRIELGRAPQPRGYISVQEFMP